MKSNNLRLAAGNRIQDNEGVLRLKFDYFPNTYLRFWGIKIPILYIESLAQTYQNVNKCFVHISVESNVHPEIILILEMDNLENVNNDCQIIKKEGDLKKDLKALIKNNLSDFIEIETVNRI